MAKVNRDLHNSAVGFSSDSLWWFRGKAAGDNLHRKFNAIRYVQGGMAMDPGGN